MFGTYCRRFQNMFEPVSGINVVIDTDTYQILREFPNNAVGEREAKLFADRCNAQGKAF